MFWCDEFNEHIKTRTIDYLHLYSVVAKKSNQPNDSYYVSVTENKGDLQCKGPKLWLEEASWKTAKGIIVRLRRIMETWGITKPKSWVGNLVALRTFFRIALSSMKNVLNFHICDNTMDEKLIRNAFEQEFPETNNGELYRMIIPRLRTDQPLFLVWFQAKYMQLLKAQHRNKKKEFSYFDWSLLKGIDGMFIGTESESCYLSEKFYREMNCKNLTATVTVNQQSTPVLCDRIAQIVKEWQRNEREIVKFSFDLIAKVWSEDDMAEMARRVADLIGENSKFEGIQREENRVLCGVVVAKLGSVPDWSILDPSYFVVLWTKGTETNGNEKNSIHIISATDETLVS